MVVKLLFFAMVITRELTLDLPRLYPERVGESLRTVGFKWNRGDLTGAISKNHESSERFIPASYKRLP
jgi:hypothetical protein